MSLHIRLQVLKAVGSVARRTRPRRDASGHCTAPTAPSAIEPVERLEDRVLLSAAAADGTASHVVYVESNNPDSGKNAVLAYRQNPDTGALTPLPGSPFLTHGTGVFNADEGLGPDDSDQQVIVSPDHKFLFAVNQESNTVAVFRIRPDGSLRLVPGAPFKSNGVHPVSLGLAGNRLYVVNQGDQAPGQTTGSLPNITAFKVGSNGALSKISGSRVQFPPGSSPAQALVSKDGKFLFGDNLFARPFPAPGLPPFIPPFSSELESFRIGTDGKLTRAPGSPYGAPFQPPATLPFLLGLQVHPTRNILYTGFVASNQLGVYTYNRNTGALTFVRTVATSGLGICWITTNKAGTRLYAANSTSNSIDVFDISDALHPKELQNLELNGPKAPLPPTPPAPVIFNTTPFELSLDPAGKFLYVISHETTLTNDNPSGNALHVLKVEPDGLLAERIGSPVVLPESLVPARAHPQGVAVI